MAGAFIRLKSVKSTLLFAGSISLAITVSQLSACSFHPRLLCARDMLLTYTHIFFSSSVYYVVVYMLGIGVGVGMFFGAVFAVAVVGLFSVGAVAFCGFCIYSRSIVCYI